MRRPRPALLALVPLLLLQPAGPLAPGTAQGATSTDLVAEVLTAGPEQYVVRAAASGEVTVRARAPRDARPPDPNRREILVRRGDAASIDQTVCATWTDQSRHEDQEGLAVRVRVGPGERTRAITLTKNTYADFVWVFNLLSWDTRRQAQAWRPLGQFDLGPVLSPGGHLRPLPWRVCLRAAGTRVGFKVWLPERTPEPSWTDPVHSRWVTVRHRLLHPGVAGWYVGHLRPGDHVRYADLTSEAARTGYPARHDRG